MPSTGYDPTQHGAPADVSGGGLDPSAYYALSPGGRFPGDVWAYLEWLAGADRGTAGGNPDAEVPAWAETGGGRLGQLVRWHVANQQGGPGQSPNLPGGYPYQFYSGPGARYGPPGGPLHGLVDQENPYGFFDGPMDPQSQESPRQRPRGGGGGGGNYTFTPYQGLNHQAQFVDWQPDRPLSEPTLWSPGAGQSFRPPAPPPASGQSRPGGGRGGGGGGRGGGGGGRGGRGRGNAGRPIDPAGGGRPRGVANMPLPPGAPRPGEPGFLEWLFEATGGRPEVNSPVGGGPPGGGGYDTNNLDRGTPGWQNRPELGNQNTAGFPLPTPRAPLPGEGFDAYMTYLHDLGYDQESILGLMGPNGYAPGTGATGGGAQGGPAWEGTTGLGWAGWGTGPVVRGPEGYQFANQGGGHGGGNETSSSGSTTLDNLLYGFGSVR